MTAAETLNRGRGLDAAQVRYVGVADWWGYHVWRERAAMRTRLRYSHGSVMTFAWGRAGQGSRELARAILDDAIGDPGLTARLSDMFVHEVIGRLASIGFELDRDEVLAWVARQRATGQSDG